MATLPPSTPDQSFCTVSALEGGRIHLLDEMFITGASPGKCTLAPSLSFLLVHSKTKKKFIFDLGIRKDWYNYPPVMVDWINNVFPVQVPQDVFDTLAKGNTYPEDIDYVALSHCHWDHTGNTLPFTKSEFIVGAESQALISPGYPEDPDGAFASNLLPSGRTRFLDTYGPDFKPIGPFPHALDFFGDGSVYIVDAAGHLPGHINLLARASPDGAWVYLAGDSAHHWNLITGASTVSIGHPGHRADSCAHANRAQAEQHIARIQQLRSIPRVQVFLAHDSAWYEANKGGPAFWPGTIPPL